MCILALYGWGRIFRDSSIYSDFGKMFEAEVKSVGIRPQDGDEILALVDFNNKPLDPWKWEGVCKDDLTRI